MSVANCPFAFVLPACQPAEQLWNAQDEKDDVPLPTEAQT